MIENVSGGISVTILKDIFSRKHLIETGLNERQIKAITFLKENGKITNKDYQILNNISRETATRDLKKLVELGIIKTEGLKGAGSFYELN